MITIEQCRAARGLLGWTQQDLADASGLSKTAINNYEKGHSDIKAESLKAIRMAFESADIEFLEDNGLRKRSEGAEILKGEKTLSLLLDDILVTGLESDEDILITCAAIPEKSAFHTEAVQERLRRLPTGRLRVLCTDKTQALWKDCGACRVAGGDIAPLLMTTFLYSPKLALLFRDEQSAILLSGPDICKAEQARFEELWARAAPVQSGQSTSSKTR